MYQKEGRVWSLTLVLCLLIALSGCATKIRHSNVIEPMYPMTASSDLSNIGATTSVKTVNGILYIGAKEGLAAMDPSGKVLWTLGLPSADLRLIDADADGVAFTSYNVTGQKKEKTLLLFTAGKSVTVENVTVGLATANGTLVWSVESSEQTLHSPPALSKNAVGVNRYLTFALYDRTSGKEISQTKFEGELESVLKTKAVTRPAVMNDTFYVGRSYKIRKIDEHGKLLDAKTGYGLFSPVSAVTAGPVVFNDLIVFAGEGAVGGGPSRVFAVDKDIDDSWIEKVKAVDTCGFQTKCWYYVDAIGSNANSVYVSTEITLSAYNKKGSLKWMDWNKKGGLYPGQRRYVGAPGVQIVATDKNVYVTSNWSKTTDAITILDAETGKYVESLKVNAQILDMAIVGSNIALATDQGLKFIALK